MVVSYVTVDCSAGRIETEACMEGIDGWVRLANDSSAMTVATGIDMDHERICSKNFPSRKHNLEDKVLDESHTKRLKCECAGVELSLTDTSSRCNKQKEKQGERSSGSIGHGSLFNFRNLETYAATKHDEIEEFSD